MALIFSEKKGKNLYFLFPPQAGQGGSIDLLQHFALSTFFDTWYSAILDSINFYSN
jgi:hypothetical protein